MVQQLFPLGRNILNKNRSTSFVFLLFAHVSITVNARLFAPQNSGSDDVFEVHYLPPHSIVHFVIYYTYVVPRNLVQKWIVNMIARSRRIVNQTQTRTHSILGMNNSPQYAYGYMKNSLPVVVQMCARARMHHIKNDRQQQHQLCACLCVGVGNMIWETACLQQHRAQSMNHLAQGGGGGCRFELNREAQTRKPIAVLRSCCANRVNVHPSGNCEIHTVLSMGFARVSSFDTAMYRNVWSVCGTWNTIYSSPTLVRLNVNVRTLADDNYNNIQTIQPSGIIKMSIGRSNELDMYQLNTVQMHAVHSHCSVCNEDAWLFYNNSACMSGNRTRPLKSMLFRSTLA